MGYRSDVVALVYPGTEFDAPARTEQYNVLKTLMNTTYKGVWDELSAFFEWDDAEQVLKFRGEGVKWYPSYPDVQAFETFLSDAEGLGYDTEFVRVGEEYNDIETRYSDHASYHLDVCREITCGV